MTKAESRGFEYYMMRTQLKEQMGVGYDKSEAFSWDDASWRGFTWVGTNLQNRAIELIFPNSIPNPGTDYNFDCVASSTEYQLWEYISWAQLQDKQYGIRGNRIVVRDDSCATIEDYHKKLIGVIFAYRYR